MPGSNSSMLRGPGEDRTYGRQPGRPGRKPKKMTFQEFMSRDLTPEEVRCKQYFIRCKARGIQHLDQLSRELEWPIIWNTFCGHAYSEDQEIITDNAESVNNLARLVNTAVAYHTSGDVRFYLSGRQPEDDAFASGLDPLVAFWWQKMRLRAKRRLAFTHRLTLGSGLLKLGWDPYLYYDNLRGEVFCDAVDPRLLWFDPSVNEDTIQAAQWLGHEMMRDNFHIARNYNLDLGEYDAFLDQNMNNVQAPTGVGFLGNVIGADNSSNQFMSGFGRSIRPTFTHRVTEFYWRDSEQPMGRVATFIDDQIVPNSIRDNPVPSGRWPFVSYPDNPFENRPVGRSGSYLIMPMVRQYDKCESIKADWREAMVTPPLIAAIDTGIPDDKLHPFARWAIRPQRSEQAQGIRFMELPALSNVPTEQQQQLLQMMDAVFGINAMGLQTRPVNGVSGQALQILAQAQDQRMALDKQVIGDGDQLLGSIYCELALKYYTGERIMQLQSTDSSKEWLMLVGNIEQTVNEQGQVVPVKNGRKWFDLTHWKGNEVVNFQESFADPEIEVRVDTGSVVPPTPAVMQQDLADLWQRYPEIPLPVRLKYDLQLRPYLPANQIIKEVTDQMQQQQQAQAQAPPADMFKSNGNYNADLVKLLMLMGDPTLDPETKQVAQQFISLVMKRVQIDAGENPNAPPQQQAQAQGQPPQGGPDASVQAGS